MSSYHFKVYQPPHQYHKIDTTTQLIEDDWGWYIDMEAGNPRTKLPYYVIKTWQMNRGDKDKDEDKDEDDDEDEDDIEEAREDDDPRKGIRKGMRKRQEEQDKKKQKRLLTCNPSCIHILVHVLGIVLCYFLV
jgi:hypothetical protein